MLRRKWKKKCFWEKWCLHCLAGTMQIFGKLFSIVGLQWKSIFFKAFYNHINNIFHQFTKNEAIWALSECSFHNLQIWLLSGPCRGTCIKTEFEPRTRRGIQINNLTCNLIFKRSALLISRGGGVCLLRLRCWWMEEVFTSGGWCWLYRGGRIGGGILRERREIQKKSERISQWECPYNLQRN